MLRLVNRADLVVEQARLEAGLSRRALAARSGVPTSTVSRIENGTMDPTVTMLERVLAAAGQVLHITIRPVTDRPSLARLADAVDEAPSGVRVDWTRLRGFVDWLALHPDQLAASVAAPPARTGTVLDALLAGMAEKLSADAGLTPPRWARSVPPLGEPWVTPGTPRMVAQAELRTPPEFRRRNIVLDERSLWRAGG